MTYPHNTLAAIGDKVLVHTTIRRDPDYMYLFHRECNWETEDSFLTGSLVPMLSRCGGA